MSDMISGVKAKVHSIHDNIGDTLDKYDIGSFLEGSEVSEYLEKIPGFKDLLMAITKIFDFVKDLIDKIFAFIEKILNIINAFIDKIEAFVRAIFDAINSLLVGFGMSLGFKRGLLASLITGCFTLNSGDKFKFLIGLILGALIGMTGCTEDGSSIYGKAYGHYINSDDMAYKRDELNALNYELGTTNIFTTINNKQSTINDNNTNINIIMSNNDTLFRDGMAIVNAKTVELRGLDAQISQYHQGALVEDILSLRKKERNLKGSIVDIREDLDALIEESDDTEVIALLSDVEILKSEIELVRNLADGDREYIEIKNKITALETTIGEDIEDINTLFIQIGQLSLALIFTNEDTDNNVMISYIDSMMDVRPGIDSIKSMDGFKDILISKLTCGVDNKKHTVVSGKDKGEVYTSSRDIVSNVKSTPASYIESHQAIDLLKEISISKHILPEYEGKFIDFINSGRLLTTGLHYSDRDVNELLRIASKTHDFNYLLYTTGTKKQYHNDHTLIYEDGFDNDIVLNTGLTRTSADKLLTLLKELDLLNLDNMYLFRNPVLRKIIREYLLRENIGEIDNINIIPETDERLLLIL